ncbi:MAG: Calx-beta domain-containing protein [Planctomycetota bacterium]
MKSQHVFLFLAVFISFSVIAVDDANITTANSYDDAWESGWITNLRTLYTGTVPGGGATPKTVGFTFHIGDSITYQNQYAYISINGTPSNAAFQAIIDYTECGQNTNLFDCAADYKNGWALARRDLPSGGQSFTAASGIRADQYLDGSHTSGKNLNTMLNNTTPTVTANGAIVHDAMYCVIMLGTNDVSANRTPAAVKANLSTVIDLLVAKKIMPILSTIPPRGDSATNETRTNALNPEIRALAQEKNVPLLDLNAEMKRRQPTGWSVYLTDGVHLTSSSGDVIANPALLSNYGQNLRGFLAICKIMEIKDKVIDNYNPNFTILTSSPLTQGYVSTAYPSTTLTSLNGTGTVTWLVTAGALPGGMTLSTAGVLSGTPTASGTFGFTVQATDSTTPTAQTATKVFSLEISSGTAPTTATINPLKDSYTDSGNATTNYGADTNNLNSSGNNDIPSQTPVLEFDLAGEGIDSSVVISSATLRLYCVNDVGYGGTPARGCTMSVAALLNSFTELGVTHSTRDGSSAWGGSAINAGVTFNFGGWESNAGTNVTAPYDTVVKLDTTNATNSWLEWDVTTLVQEWASGSRTNNGLAVLGFARVPSESFGWSPIYFSSKGGAHPPELVVEYTGGTPPSPGTIGFESGMRSVSENAGTITLNVTRTGGTLGAVTLSVAATGSGANPASGADYTLGTTTLTFPDGSSATQTVSITITNDSLQELTETFNVTIAITSGTATLGTATCAVSIVDDDQPGEIIFSVASYSANENAGSTSVVTVRRTVGSLGAVTVGVQVNSGTPGTATVGVDYVLNTTSVSFADGDSADKTVSITIIDDSDDEGASETVNLILSIVSGSDTLGIQTTCTLTIADNDTFEKSKTETKCQQSPVRSTNSGAWIVAFFILLGGLGLRRRTILR